jgi:hypothetical protein
MGGPPRSSKELGTIRSRRIHYFIFCNDLKLTDDWLLVHVAQERRVYQLALYAAHLATGNNLFCTHLKGATIEAYLRDVAKFLRRFCLLDPRYLQPTDTRIATPIAAVINEVKRVEQMPNKCEPFTLAMRARLATWASDRPGDDHLLAALSDWATINLYQGARLSEWAQTSSNSGLHSAACDESGIPLAFCLADCSFSDVTGRRLTLDSVLSNPGQCFRITMRWSHQKNKNHGEKRLFVRNATNPKCCYVIHALVIIQRFLRLVGHKLDIPLAVYIHPFHGFVFITETEITKIFRALACEVYNLDPKNDKIKFSSHSLRVGACVLLHSQGFTHIQIKFLLRWKSDAFMEYLRNVPLLSHQQNQAVDFMDRMPNLM